MFNYKEFNEKIKNVFSEEELREIVKKAACWSEDVIFINLDCGAIEIAADKGEELEMFFMSNDDTSGKSISKEEVLEIVRKGKKANMVCVCVDE